MTTDSENKAPLCFAKVTDSKGNVWQMPTAHSESFLKDFFQIQKSGGITEGGSTVDIECEPPLQLLGHAKETAPERSV